VTSENVEEYIVEVIEAIIGQGAKLQAKAFREGFSKVFPITDLQAFALDELVMLFGNAEEDWSIECRRLSVPEAMQILILHSIE
jgi:E3 ubiquitin-protein ligase TRIP12